jgi:hypothetical protein
MKTCGDQPPLTNVQLEVCLGEDDARAVCKREIWVMVASGNRTEIPANKLTDAVY